MGPIGPAFARGIVDMPTGARTNRTAADRPKAKGKEAEADLRDDLHLLTLLHAPLLRLPFGLALFPFRPFLIVINPAKP
jgi:hypothetical protein